MTVTPDGLGRLPDARKDGVPPWFVDIGEPEPLMSTAELKASIARGEVPAGTLVWRLGMDNWVPYETLEEIQSTDVVGATAHEPPVTPVVPSGPESDPPRDTCVERTVPFDTDPAPPPQGDSEPSDGGRAARVRRSRGRGRAHPPLDTSPEDHGQAPPDASHAQRGRDHQGPLAEDHGHDERGTAPSKHRSLWRQPQASLPPRPSLSVAAVPRPTIKASTEQHGSASATPTPERAASPPAKTGSPEPGAATQPDDKPNRLPPPDAATPGLGSASAVAREPQERRMLLSPTAPAGTRAGMLSDAPTNPRQNALPAAAGSVIAPDDGPGAPQPTPGQTLEPRTTDASDGQDVKAPRAEDDTIEPQESSGAHVENVTVVRFKVDALRARYLRLMVAVAVAAAACAALVTALLMRRAAPVLPPGRAVPLEAQAPRAPAPPVERPATPVEALSVEALPTESPPSTEAPPDEPRADSSTAPSRFATPHGTARPGSSDNSGVGTSETAQSGERQRVDSKPANGNSGLDDAGTRPRAAAASQPEPASKASPEPTLGASSPAAASGKAWKANDPGF